MMTRPGFLALAVMLALTVALALAGPNTRDMSSLLRCSQCKNHSPKQSHSPSQKTGTCHHVVWAPHFLISKHTQKHKRTHKNIQYHTRSIARTNYGHTRCTTLPCLKGGVFQGSAQETPKSSQEAPKRDPGGP